MKQNPVMQQFTGFIFFYATNRFPEDVKFVLKILVYESSVPENVMENYKKM